MTLLEQLDMVCFAAKTMPIYVCGGIKEEPVEEEIPVITGSRKRIYQNFGNIFGAILPGATTTLVPGVRPGPAYLDFSRAFVSSYIPLYILGANNISTNRPLYMNGGYLSIANYMPLVCVNLAISNNIPCYIGGLGGTAGAIPASSRMNLFIKTMFTEAIPMYMLCGPQPSNSGNRPLYIYGSIAIGSNIPLTISKVSVITNSIVPMYISGF